MRHTVDAYQEQLLALLPQGAAWSRDRGGVLGRLFGALADALARVDGRGADLVEEADPRTTLELLPDWERVAGLPDACTGEPDNVHERQVAVTERLARRGGQSIGYFTELAARLGYDVLIEEYRPARLGMRCGEPLNGEAWAFVWRMDVFVDNETLGRSVAVATARSRMGERLRGFGSLDLECVVTRAAPAHTIVFFAYPVDPEPAFLFDFTAPGD